MSSLLHEEVTEIETIDFVGLRIFYHKHQCRNFNAYPKTYYHESISLSKENSEIWSNYRNDNLENSEG